MPLPPDLPLFSPEKARGEPRRVRAAEVVDLLPLTHAPETVRAYREALLAGDAFPPVAVVRLLGRWVIADGHKRWSAAASLGLAEVVVDVWPLRLLLVDQLRQARAAARKNARFARGLLVDRAEARRIALDTVGHWRRVGASLLSLARGLPRGRP